MRTTRWLVIPIFLLVALGCNLIPGVKSIQNIASTQLPSILTSVPTAQGFIETMAALPSSTPCVATSTSGGLGIALDHTKTILQATKQFIFTDGTVDGQPASIATLDPNGPVDYSAVSKDFSAKFIGDPCNLSRILVTAPYTSDQATVDQGMAAANVLLTTLVPLDIQLPLLAWLATTYSNVPVSGSEQTTIQNMHFTLSRTQTEMSLEVVPAK